MYISGYFYWYLIYSFNPGGGVYWVISIGRFRVSFNPGGGFFNWQFVFYPGGGGFQYYFPYLFYREFVFLTLARGDFGNFFFGFILSFNPDGGGFLLFRVIFFRVQLIEFLFF